MSKSVSGNMEITSYACSKCGTIHLKGVDDEFDSHMKYLFYEWKETIEPVKVIFT